MTLYVAIVSQQKGIKLAGLCIVDVTMFVIGAVKTRIHHVVATQIANVMDVAERSPANEVNVQITSRGCRSYNVNVQIARLPDLKIIESGVGR